MRMIGRHAKHTQCRKYIILLFIIYLFNFFPSVDEFRRKFHPLNLYLISERQLFILHLELLLFLFLSFIHSYTLFVSSSHSYHPYILLSLCSFLFDFYFFCFVWLTELKSLQFWNVSITYWFRGKTVGSSLIYTFDEMELRKRCPFLKWINLVGKFHEINQIFGANKKKSQTWKWIHRRLFWNASLTHPNAY